MLKISSNNLKTQMKIISLKIITATIFTIVLGACGGGSSDSGGPAAPVAPPLTLFTAGAYNGELNLTTEGENIVSDTSPTPLLLEVTGNVAGAQQVRVAFAQFSGTSAIGPDGEFSIPSGVFPLRVSDNRNRIIATCQGELLFDGTFVGDTVSGNATTTAPFVCDLQDLGPITLTGTFEASLGAAKRFGSGQGIVVKASNY